VSGSKKIVAVAEQSRPGIQPYRIKVEDYGIECDDPFHHTGEGGTEPAKVSERWTMTHCARINCDGTTRIHEALGAIMLGQPSITCPVCHKTSYHPTDVEMGYCGNCHGYTSPVDPLATARRVVRQAEEEAREHQPKGEPGE
jgi:hypothetical protein